MTTVKNEELALDRRHDLMPRAEDLAGSLNRLKEEGLRLDKLMSGHQ